MFRSSFVFVAAIPVSSRCPVVNNRVECSRSVSLFTINNAFLIQLVAANNNECFKGVHSSVISVCLNVRVCVCVCDGSLRDCCRLKRFRLSNVSYTFSLSLGVIPTLLTDQAPI